MIPVPDAFIARKPRMTEEMQAYLYRSPIPNLHILQSQLMGDASYISNEMAPAKGVMGLAGTGRGVGPFVFFSEGDPAYQLFLTDFLRRGERYIWNIPDERLYEELVRRLRSPEFAKMAVYERAPTGPLPAGAARQLSKADIPALRYLRPSSVRALTSIRQVEVFGIIENGQWLADGWVLPVFGKYWGINDLTVHPDHWRSGLGKATLAACLNHLSEAGMTAIYETDDDNLPSRRLAESLGFELKGTFAIGKGTLDWPPSKEGLDFLREVDEKPGREKVKKKKRKQQRH